jgi:hypothetical protein
MIASFKYNFIFVRTKKTASTAVELGLSTICGPEDIISPIGAGQELIRSKSGIHPRNFTKDPVVERELLDAIKFGRAKKIRQASTRNRITNGCTGHMRAREVKQWVSDEFWNSACKFTTERHPYEKALSLAHFGFGRLSGTPSFEAVLDHVVKESYRTYRGYKVYFIGGKSAMDVILRQDRLADDIADLRSRLNLPEFELPRARGKRQDRRPAREVLTDAQKEFIYQQCKPEFDLLGWEK